MLSHHAVASREFECEMNYYAKNSALWRRSPPPVAHLRVLIAHIHLCPSGITLQRNLITTDSRTICLNSTHLVEQALDALLTMDYARINDDEILLPRVERAQFNRE